MLYIVLTSSLKCGQYLSYPFLYIVLGTLTGAFVVFSCKMKGRSNVLLIAIISFTSIFLSLVFLLHCPGAEVAGITVPYQE